LSLGLETSRDPFLQVLVSILVLEPQSLGLGLGLGLGTLESRSRSWSWNLRVLVWVLVLEPSSLGLGLGLGTSESWFFWSLVLEPSSLGLGLGLGTCDHEDSTMKTRSSSLMKREIVRLPPLLPWNGYLATVVCSCGQTGLEWVTTCRHSWSTCDATISCNL